MSTEIAASTAAAPPPVGRRPRTRWSRHRCRPPGTAPARRGRVPDGAGEGEPGLLVAGHHLRLDTERGEHHRPELVGVLGVPGRRGGAHPDPVRAQCSIWRRSRPAPPGSVRSPPEPADRCGRRPGRAARSPSVGPRRPARPPDRPIGRSATSRRIEFVPQSIAATRRHDRLTAAATGHGRPGSQPQQHAGVAEGVRLDPLQAEELGDALVVRAQQLLVDGRRYRCPVDLRRTRRRRRTGSRR